MSEKPDQLAVRQRAINVLVRGVTLVEDLELAKKQFGQILVIDTEPETLVLYRTIQGEIEVRKMLQEEEDAKNT